KRAEWFGLNVVENPLVRNHVGSSVLSIRGANGGGHGGNRLNEHEREFLPAFRPVGIFLGTSVNDHRTSTDLRHFRMTNLECPTARRVDPERLERLRKYMLQDFSWRHHDSQLLIDSFLPSLRLDESRRKFPHLHCRLLP